MFAEEEENRNAGRLVEFPHSKAVDLPHVNSMKRAEVTLSDGTITHFQLSFIYRLS